MTVTVFMVAGSQDPAVDDGLSDIFITASADLPRPIDTTVCTYMPVRFPEVLRSIGPGATQGKAALIEHINAWDGPFILLGSSEGAAICSDVYDELRSGALQNRRADLLGAVTYGNPRRGTGHTFTDPVYGQALDSCPDCSGISSNPLQDAEPLWWDCAVAGDPVTCVSNTSQMGVWQRKLYTAVTANTLLPLLWLLASTAFKPWQWSVAWPGLHLYLTLAKTPHTTYNTAIPFAGDTRTFWQVGVDYINDLARGAQTP